ncbi:TRAP transporter solute receptor, TAXI family [Burkholderiales bacterium JOSHI_001]|nr:TRAP transporter solute receptor, TAXI family [Burkholderiales bacterium JOSHI_001]
MNKRVWIGALACLAWVGAVRAEQALRIGTGMPGAADHPVGGAMAEVISKSGKLTAKALASLGSVTNVKGLVNNHLDSALVHADVATWAQQGTQLFEGKAVPGLRLVANLYPVNVTLVARKGLGLRTPADLKGKRVGLGGPGSATLTDARLILGAYGLKESDLQAELAPASKTIDKLGDGSLDALFVVGDLPAADISSLVLKGVALELVPIAGAKADALRKTHPYFVPNTVAAGTFKGVGSAKTLAVNMQWVALETLDANTAYEATRAVFSPAGLKAVAASAGGGPISGKNAVTGATVAFHPGAQKFYREAGLLK